MSTLTRTDSALVLDLSGDPDFQGSLAKVKDIPGRRFDPVGKNWEMPLDSGIADRVLSAIRPKADPGLVAWARAGREERERELTTPLPVDAELSVPWGPRLYPYQRAAVDFMADNPRVILGDDLGLGKTVQALSTIAEHRHRHGNPGGPSLVIAPASVVGVWHREIGKWLGEETPRAIIQGTPKKRAALLDEMIEAGGFCIVNWEGIRAEPVVVQSRTNTVDHRGRRSTATRKSKTHRCKERRYEETNWGAVVADEAHRAKNRKALVTLGLQRIQAPVQLAMTGTPVQNHPGELWSILRWLYPDTYGRSSKDHPRTPYWTFHNQYVDQYEDGRGFKVITGVRNPEALRFELSRRLVRRTKGQVLDLPEKTRERVPIALGTKQRKLYKTTEREVWVEVEQAARDGNEAAARIVRDPKLLYDLENGAVRTVRLRQVASTPALLGGEDDSAKLDAAVEIIGDAQPRQFVVFSEFTRTCGLMVERLKRRGIDAEAYTGALSQDARTHLEDRFQRGEVTVVVGTIKAMKEGITLHAADTVIFLERDWNPTTNTQCEDRLHRIGQRNAVTVLILEAEDTVDTKRIQPTNELKDRIISAIVRQDHIEEREYQ